MQKPRSARRYPETLATFSHPREFGLRVPVGIANTKDSRNGPTQKDISVDHQSLERGRDISAKNNPMGSTRLY